VFLYRVMPSRCEMKKYIIYKSLIVLLVISFSALSKAESFIPIETMGDAVVHAVSYKTSAVKLDKAIDGKTGASKLRAKKSHSVSKQDETKLIVFLGLFAMAIIVFFIKFFTNGK